MTNQNPEQIARDAIDSQLIACGWVVQELKKVNLNIAVGVAVKEYLTDVGPADYVLFVDGKPCGVIEAKREEEGARLHSHEDQAEGYAAAKLKHLKNKPLPFVFISTGEITRFTDFADSKPRGREVSTRWNCVVLNDICNIKEGIKKGKDFKKQKPIFLPYLRVANVQGGYLDL